MNQFNHANHRIAGLSVLLILVFSLAACGGGSDGDTKSDNKTKNPALLPLSSLLLERPADCNQFKNYVVQSIVKRNTVIPRSCGTLTRPSVKTAGPTTTRKVAAASSKPTGVSGTNNQVAGVNENDTVKADDNGIVYIASGRNLVIAQGFPPQNLKTLKELNLDGRVTDLFLDKLNKRLIVVSQFQAPYTIFRASNKVKPGVITTFMPAPVQGATDILFLDVSTPAAPIKIKQLRLKGFFQTGRRIKDRLHLILRNYSNFNKLLDSKFRTLTNDFTRIAEKVRCDGETDSAIIAKDPKVIAAKAAVSSYATTLFEPVVMADYLPTAQQIGAKKTKPVNIPFLACSDIQHPKVSSNLAMQVITSIDTNGANMGTTAMINNAWQTYVSAKNIYVAETSQNWWWNTTSNTRPTSQTAIYKFAISKQKPTYAATGSIEGYVKNQFNFSEFNGDLRVATTQDDWFSKKDAKGILVRNRVRSNNIFVMRDNNSGTLETIGSVRGFGKTENIRSSLFLGSRAFVVTFRTIDPLFTFDLSKPTAPKLMGELTIPGFSSYMQAYDDDHLITIGPAAGAGGRGVGSVQLQLFNIADLTNPLQKQVHLLIPPNTPTAWAWSSAQYDHKAFTFYKLKNLLAIPVQISGTKSGPGFSGVYAFDVSLTNGFTLLSRVDHADLAKQYYCNRATKPNPGGKQAVNPYGCNDGSIVRWASPRRSVVMTSATDVYLYTISDVGMKVGNVTDLSVTLGKILFPEQAYPWFYIRTAGALTL